MKRFWQCLRHLFGSNTETVRRADIVNERLRDMKRQIPPIRRLVEAMQRREDDDDHSHRNPFH